MIISEKIFHILNEKGISQKAFSQRTGISQSTISDWKRKGTNPSADKIMTICAALNISVYDLLNEDEDSSKKQLEYIIIDKKSDEYTLVTNYQKLDKKARERIIGYMDALKTED